MLQIGQTPSVIIHLMSAFAALGIYLRSARPFLPGFSLPAHSSRFSLRRPQCVSLRDGLNSRWTCRFGALRIADARHHGGPVELDDQEQGFDRGLPLLEQLFGLRKIGDVSASVFEGDKLATAGQENRIIERPLPALRHQANSSAPACVNFTKTPESCPISQPLALASS